MRAGEVQVVMFSENYKYTFDLWSNPYLRFMKLDETNTLRPTSNCYGDTINHHTCLLIRLPPPL